jgi:hypothetical protein
MEDEAQESSHRLVGVRLFNVLDLSTKEKHSEQSCDSQNRVVVHYSSYCNCTRQFISQPSDGRESWCSEEATMRGPGQNIVVYSLYGDAVMGNKTTTYYLLLNTIPRAADQFYPGRYRTPDNSNLMMRLKNRHIALCVISVIGCLICWTYLQEKTKVNDVVTQNTQNQVIVHYSSYCNCTRQFIGQSSDGTENWCSEEATMRGSGQNIVVYSLYGDAVKDNRPTTYYLVLNTIPREVEQFYPGKNTG